MARRPPASHRATRITSAALFAVLATAGIAWAWTASTTNPASSVTAGSLATPGAPTATRTGGAGNNCTAISVAWTAVSNATSYRVERNVNGSWTTLATNHATTNYGDTGNWTNYQVDYRITALLDNWQSAAPAIASLACGVGDVSDLQATFQTNCRSTALSWSMPLGGITSYDLQYRLNGGAWTAVASGTGITGTTFNDNTVYATPHATVEYQVLARVGATVGSPSNLVSATTDYGCLVPPTNPAASGCLINSKAISWTAAPSPVTEYTVRRRVNAGAWSSATTNVAGTTWTDATSHPVGQLVEYGLFSENSTLVDDVLSMTAPIYSGFYARAIAFGNAGTLGTLNVGDTVVVTFSQPVSNAVDGVQQIRTLATGTGTRGIYLDATTAAAASTDIGYIGTAASHFSTGTANGNAVWSNNNTVWTWTSTSAGITHAANIAASGWTAGTAASRVKCGTTNNLLATAPTYSGRW